MSDYLLHRVSNVEWNEDNWNWFWLLLLLLFFFCRRFGRINTNWIYCRHYIMKQLENGMKRWEIRRHWFWWVGLLLSFRLSCRVTWEYSNTRWKHSIIRPAEAFQELSNMPISCIYLYIYYTYKLWNKYTYVWLYVYIYVGNGSN